MPSSGHHKHCTNMVRGLDLLCALGLSIGWLAPPFTALLPAACPSTNAALSRLLLQSFFFWELLLLLGSHLSGQLKRPWSAIDCFLPLPREQRAPGRPWLVTGLEASRCFLLFWFSH